MLLKSIKERRSVRQYYPDQIPRETLERLLEAAAWSPSAHNRQPWRFVVINDNALKQVLAHAMAGRLAQDLRQDGVSEAEIARDTGRSLQRLTGTPVLIIVCLSMADMDKYPDQARQHLEYLMAVQSVAMASQNLLLMAAAEGLGACWMCAPLFCPDTVRQTLSLPIDFEPQGLITLGYPAQIPTRTRDPIHTKVIFR